VSGICRKKGYGRIKNKEKHERAIKGQIKKACKEKSLNGHWAWKLQHMSMRYTAFGH